MFYAQEATKADLNLYCLLVLSAEYMQLYTPLLPLKDEHELWLGDKTENIVVK